MERDEGQDRTRPPQHLHFRSPQSAVPDLRSLRPTRRERQLFGPHDIDHRATVAALAELRLLTRHGKATSLANAQRLDRDESCERVCPSVRTQANTTRDQGGSQVS